MQHSATLPSPQCAKIKKVVVHGLEEVPKTAFQRAGRCVICTYLSHPPLYCLFDCVSIHLPLLDFFDLYLTPLCTYHALPNQAGAREETIYTLQYLHDDFSNYLIHKKFPHFSLIPAFCCSVTKWFIAVWSRRKKHECIFETPHNDMSLTVKRTFFFTTTPSFL